MTSVTKIDENSVWQDREISFDLYLFMLEMGRGEKKLDTIHDIEDTKGNPGERGIMIVTNLRMIWQSSDWPKTNLSVGQDCMLNIEIKSIPNVIGGHKQALSLRTRYKNNRFEFVFTSLKSNNPQLFTQFQAICRCQETTKLQRDLKLRGAIIQDKQLILLPKEQLYNQWVGVWNLSSEQGNLGLLAITNIRIVWFANLAENFNVSLPWIQVKNIKMRESKFGMALVVETIRFSGGYVLGFRMDNITETFKELTTLHKIFIKNPIFGIELVNEGVVKENVTVDIRQDDIEIIDSDQYFHNKTGMNAYIVGCENTGNKEIEFSKELGLAVEKMSNNVSIEQLWKIF